MALLVQPGDITVPPSPSPSPARVGSSGPIRFLMAKERPMNHHQPVTHRAKSSKEVSVVCREAVSISCGQPLLSSKPKRTECIKTSKTSSAQVSKVLPPAAKLSHPFSAEKSSCSTSSRVRVNSIRFSGCSEVHPDVDVPVNPVGLHYPASHGEELPQTSVRLDAHQTRKVPAHSDATQQGEYPVFQSSASPLNSHLDDYHKALIPFLRNELDAPAKALKKRLSNQTIEFNSHLRTTSLRHCASSAGRSEQVDWRAYSRDSYPPFGQSKTVGFVRLTNYSLEDACTTQF